MELSQRTVNGVPQAITTSGLSVFAPVPRQDIGMITKKYTYRITNQSTNKLITFHKDDVTLNT